MTITCTWICPHCNIGQTGHYTDGPKAGPQKRKLRCVKCSRVSPTHIPNKDNGLHITIHHAKF